MFSFSFTSIIKYFWRYFFLLSLAEVLSLRTDTSLPNCLLMTVLNVNSIASVLKRKKTPPKPQIFPHQ